MTDTAKSERPHHPFSPSKLQSLEACPCYRGRDTTTDAAERGTRQHRATETREDDSRLDDKEMAAVAACIDFVDQRKIAMEEARAAAGSTADIIELVEEYLPIDHELIEYWDEKEGAFKRARATTAGYIDRALIDHTREYAEIVDFKFGRWPVEKASHNLQGIAYALGLRKRFPTLKRVRVNFHLPHQDHLDHHDFDLEREGETLYLRIKTVVARAIYSTRITDNFNDANPTVPTCLFCSKLGRCDAVADQMLEMAHKFAPLKVPADVTPGKLRGREDAALALRCASVAKAWANALRQTVGNLVIDGSMELPPGYKIEQREGNRKVVNCSEFIALARKFGVPQQVIEAATEMTIGPIEESIRERAPRGQKKDAVTHFGDAIMAAGAVERGASYSFLKAIPTRD